MTAIPSSLFQTIVDNLQSGLLLVEAVRDSTDRIVDFRYVLTNAYNAQLAQKSVDELTGQRIGEVFSGWQQSELFERMVRVTETGEPIKTVFRYHAYSWDGWFDGSFVRVNDGVLYTYTDVTAIKQSEEAALQQSSLLVNVVNSSPSGVVLYEAIRGTDGQIIDFAHALSNPTNDLVTGRAPGELLGLRLLEHYPANRTNGHFDDLINVVETGEPLRRLMEYRAHGIDGWFDAQYIKQGDGVLFTYLDVTALKQAELAQQQQNVALEASNVDLIRSNEYLQQFAYVASHDLQEPLRKIKTFGDMLTSNYAELLPPSAQDMLHRMQNAAVRMSELVRDLLAYSRLTTERQPFQSVSLTQVIADVLNDLEITIQTCQAQVNVVGTAPTDQLPTIEADPIQMQQLFGNLISNALKFVRPTQPPVITIASHLINRASLPAHLLASIAANNTAFWEITVADNGIGFDEKHLDRMFGMFQRLHGKNQYGGSGMGLAICKRVVDNHLGGITAHSHPGQGTAFMVYLPA